MGNEKLNKRIATQRAMAVAKHLDIPDTQIIGIGQENLLYDNTLPEGRFYCRTVRITIETPIENK
jgi:outer membrane protein OmpA-like peptidoglycan-associated protein